MQTIQVTLEEMRMATRPNVYRNKKKYTRKKNIRMQSKHNAPWEMAYDVMQGDYTREEVYEMTLDELYEILTDYNEL